MKSLAVCTRALLSLATRGTGRDAGTARRAIARTRSGPSWRRIAAAAGVGMAVSMGAHAAYPEKPVQLVISSAPEAAADVLARAVGQRLSIELGHSIEVDNQPGAGGATGLMAGAQAAPDGYVLYLAATTSQAIAAAIHPDQQAHLAEDFEPIGLIGHVPHALAVPAGLPAKSVAELVDYLRAAPGKHSYASQGVGTLSHLEGELFTARYGLDVAHAPYEDSAQAFADPAGGTVAMMFDSATGSMPLVVDGKLRYLAVAASSRMDMLPDVPTLEEAGVENVIPGNYFGLFAPKDTPAAVIETASTALRLALDDPDLKQSLSARGVQLHYAPGPALLKVVEDEHAYWAEVVKSTDVRAE